MPSKKVLMMNAILLTIFVNNIVHDVMSATVVLTTRQYVQKGQAIKLNCSSDFDPIGQNAEFLINKVTYTNVRMYSFGCFNSKSAEKCFNTTCRCAQNRRSYEMYFKPDRKSDELSFSCKMRFTGNELKLSEDVVVTIIDIPSPKIHINENLPLISGTVVTFICTAPKTNSRFHFKWRCGATRRVNEMASNETQVWSTAELELNSTYDGIPCTCRIHSTNFDFVVSDFVTLKIKNKPILNLNEEYHCNGSSTIVIVCSVGGELGKFAFARWTHTLNGEYIRSIHGITEKLMSVIIFKNCNFKDGGDYTCSVWNNDGQSLLWANKTTSLRFTGPPVILSTTVEEIDTGQQIMAAFYTRSSLVSVNWQCNGVFLNHSIFKRIHIKVEIYNKQISLLAYKTLISASNSLCYGDSYCVCLVNDYAGQCEKVFFNKGANGFNVFWVMFVIILCIVTVGISPTLAKILKTYLNTASQSIQQVERDNTSADQRYLQVYESDHLATHQYDAASRSYIDVVSRHSTRGGEIDLGPYIDPLHYRSPEGYETAGMPYNDLVQYQSSRGYDVTSPVYLDVQPDTDTNSSQSDQYEKVD